jgi:hypothetical protein
MNMHILQGTAEDWGLPQARLQALDAELADHAACLEERGDSTGARELQQRANSPRGRRKLVAAHLAEQVASTLARWPSRSEWRELVWLLGWFALIMVSDIVSLYAASVGRAAGFNDWGNGDTLAPPAVTGWVTAAWLLQGIARAGFFTSFTVSLVHAWRTGAGVLLARILQLKLIHTVLVVAALWAFGNGLTNAIATSFGQGWYGYASIRVNWPDWLTAPYLLAYGLAITAALAVIRWRRLWPWALGVLLLTLFVYPAAPVRYYVTEECWPFAWTASSSCSDDDQDHIIPDTDPQRLQIRYADLVEHGWDALSMDVSKNTWKYQSIETVFVPGTVMGQYPSNTRFNMAPEFKDRYYRKRTRDIEYNLPLFSAHAALAWLAAPIPILGLIGLLGLLVLMGRRGVMDMLFYACLVFFALASTFLPFFYAGAIGGIVNFTPTGVVEGPLPGFDSLLIGSPLQEVWTLILGLLLSAGIPWLLVALFLKPRAPQLPGGTLIAD